ncbi:MAG: thiol-disulfide oxidoreductase DCC family protein [Mycobacterium sp.]
MVGVEGTLFFDGNCGMCTRARNLVLRLDRRGRIATEPFQRPGSPEKLGVSADRMVESAWSLDSSGQVYGGAESVNAALSAALAIKLPLLIYRMVPGMRRLQEGIYRWVAANRYRFPGTTPQCEDHPETCSS